MHFQKIIISIRNWTCLLVGLLSHLSSCGGLPLKTFMPSKTHASKNISHLYTLVAILASQDPHDHTATWSYPTWPYCHMIIPHMIIPPVEKKNTKNNTSSFMCAEFLNYRTAALTHLVFSLGPLSLAGHSAFVTGHWLKKSMHQWKVYFLFYGNGRTVQWVILAGT